MLDAISWTIFSLGEVQRNFAHREDKRNIARNEPCAAQRALAALRPPMMDSSKRKLNDIPI